MGEISASPSRRAELDPGTTVEAPGREDPKLMNFDGSGMLLSCLLQGPPFDGSTIRRVESLAPPCRGQGSIASARTRLLATAPVEGSARGTSAMQAFRDVAPWCCKYSCRAQGLPMQYHVFQGLRKKSLRSSLSDIPLGKPAEFGRGRVIEQMQSMQILMRWRCTG